MAGRRPSTAIFFVRVGAPTKGFPEGLRPSKPSHCVNPVSDSTSEKSQPNLTQRVAGAAAWNTVLFPVQFVVGLLAGVLMLRYLTLAQYGVLTLISGLAATIGLLSDLGMERSLPRFIPEVEQRAGRAGVGRFLRRVIALKLAIVLVCVSVMLFSSRPMLDYLLQREGQATATARQQVAQLRQAGAPPAEAARAETRLAAQEQVVGQIQASGRLFLWVVAVLVLFGALYDVGMQFLTAYFKQKAWNLITAAVALLQPLLVIAFVLAGWSVGGVLLGMVITSVVAVGLAVWQTAIAARELAPAPPAAAPDPTLPGRFTRFAGVSFLTQGTTWFYDVAFVSFALTAMGLGLEQMALLAFAYTFAKSFLSYAYLPFGGLLTPLLTRIRGRDDPAALQDAYGSVSRLFLLVLLPAGAGLALLTPALLALLYPRYTETAPLCYILIAFAFAESILSVPHNVLMVYERYRPVVAARLLALVSVPLLTLLVPAYGLAGAAVAVGVARLLPRLVTLAVVRREMGLRYPLGFAGRVLAATAAFALPLALLLPVWPFPPGAGTFAGKALAALSLGLLAALAAAVFAVALRVLGGLDASERRRILSLRLPFKTMIARLL